MRRYNWRNKKMKNKKKRVVVSQSNERLVVPILIVNSRGIIQPRITKTKTPSKKCLTYREAKELASKYK